MYWEAEAEASDQFSLMFAQSRLIHFRICACHLKIRADQVFPNLTVLSRHMKNFGLMPIGRAPLTKYRAPINKINNYIVSNWDSCMQEFYCSWTTMMLMVIVKDMNSYSVKKKKICACILCTIIFLFIFVFWRWSSNFQSVLSSKFYCYIPTNFWPINCSIHLTS